jgi:hypothetical protein
LVWFRFLRYLWLTPSAEPLTRMIIAQIPGAGRVGKEWTTVELDSEIKLVRVSGSTPALDLLCEIRVLGWFVNLSVGFPRSILRVLS